MATLAGCLEAAGFTTFLPQRDGVEAFVMGLVDSPISGGLVGRLAGRQVSKAIFAVDVYQLARCCDALVLNMNGRVPDEGAAVEAGMAFALGVPVVLYKNDHRSVFGGQDNAMLLGLAEPFASVRTAEAVVRELRAVLSRAIPRPGILPPAVARAERLGKRVWSGLRTLKPHGIGPDELEARLAEWLGEGVA